MRSTNVHETVQVGKPGSLKERVIRGMSDRIAGKAIDPRACVPWLIYEAELPPELIQELADRQ